MISYVNVNKLVAIGAIAVTSIVGYFMYKSSKKETSSVKKYKEDNLDNSIDEMIDEATIENKNIADATERAVAKEVLYSLKNDALAAVTIEEFDRKLNEVKHVSERLRECTDPLAISSTIKFYKNRMVTHQEAVIRNEDSKAELEKLRTFMQGIKDIIRTVGIYA